MKVLPERIRIVGSVGSGKTTLARQLAEELERSFYEVDQVVWMRGSNGDQKRMEKERDDMMQRLVNKKSWIIEGVHFQEWVRNSYCHADLVIFLDPPYIVRVWRIIVRYIKQIRGVESANYKPSIRIFINMFKWNHHFEFYTKKHLLTFLRENRLYYLRVRDVAELYQQLHQYKPDKRGSKENAYK